MKKGLGFTIRFQRVVVQRCVLGDGDPLLILFEEKPIGNFWLKWKNTPLRGRSSAIIRSVVTNTVKELKREASTSP